MAEIRVFHDHRFLCRAICAELAGETIALRDIIRARNAAVTCVKPCKSVPARLRCFWKPVAGTAIAMN